MAETTKPHNTCDECGASYELNKTNARLMLFIDYPTANHCMTDCPNKHTERIFTTPQGFLHLIDEAKLGITFFIMPNAELMEAADRTWATARVSEAAPQEVDVPHWMLRELYDQLREFEGGNDATHDGS